MTPRASRLARGLAALALCAVATPAGADPIALCTPDRLTCAVAAVEPDAVGGSAGSCTPTGETCTRADVRACADDGCTNVRAAVDLCGPVVRCLAVHYGPLGGIEQPALGMITITESPTSPAAMTLTGVYDPAAGEFTCTLSAPANSERTVRCVPIKHSIDWYCGGWVLTATGHTSQSQVRGQASCSDHQGYPGTSSNQTLWTDLANGAETKTNTAAQLGWFVQGAITCQAWGYSAGPKPLGSYTVTCNEPGVRTPGS